MLLKATEEGAAHVNIHTVQYPGREIRGQIPRWARDCVEVACTLSFDPVTFQILPVAPPPPGTFSLRRLSGIIRGVNVYNGDGTGFPNRQRVCVRNVVSVKMPGH